MTERIQVRLSELRGEFAAGQKALAELDAKQAELRQTLLRISGAIQVLEELTREPQEVEGNGAHRVEAHHLAPS